MNSPEQFLREFADAAIHNWTNTPEDLEKLIKGWAKLLKLREQEARRDAALRMTVGSVHEAERSSKLCYARTKQGAYIEGFRFARNNLQAAKNALTTPNNTSNTLEDEEK